MPFELIILLFIYLINIAFCIYFIFKSEILYDSLILEWEDKLDLVSMLYVLFMASISINVILSFQLALNDVNKFEYFILVSLISFIISVIPHKNKKRLENHFKYIFILNLIGIIIGLTLNLSN